MEDQFSDALRCFVPTSRRLESIGDGILEGLSFVLKDMIAVRGHVSSFGHPRWRVTHGPSLENAALVQALLMNGAKMQGITKMDQLAYSLIGNAGEGEPPMNPLYPSRFTGGSSSGSASAVAGGIADIGIGTDTAGSTRIPASACGLFAIRPTPALVSRRGVIPLAQSMDVVGVLARKANVLLASLRTLNRGAVTATEAISHVLVPERRPDHVDDAIFEIALGAASAIGAEIGARVQAVDADEVISSDASELFTRIQGREVWKNHGSWIAQNSQFLAEDVRIRLQLAKRYSRDSADAKESDHVKRLHHSRSLEKILGRRSILVLPVLPRLIPERTSSIDEQLAFRADCLPLVAPSSLSGMPEAVMPCRDDELDLTSGVGLIGPAGSDDLLCRALVEVSRGKEVVRLPRSGRSLIVKARTMG